MKNILEKEIKKHKDKMIIYEKTKNEFKSHKQKWNKHMHKLHKTIDIAKKLGFTFCECCGGLR